MTITEYINQVQKRYASGISTEHSYRPDLENLIKSIVPDVFVTNEPKRVACGAPDLIITKKDIPIGYIEAKDIGKPLDGKEYKDQFDRYRSSLPNLIITDYLEFRLYRDGVFALSVSIAGIENGKIIAEPARFDEFQDLIKDFATHIGQTIRSAEKLSKMMAGKARLMKDIFKNALEEDEADTLNDDTALQQQYKAFKDVLLHDITTVDFADIYAQTIAYGMFAARLHDPSLEDFSRQEAAELIPKTNPFLRRLFQYIAGYDLDDRIKWVVDALADIFRATDVAALLKDFGKTTQQNDPLIHFYETFLAEYDPKLRKSRGVYYTPEPVVNFIVRAVDDILKTEFGLSQGLADTSTIKVKKKEFFKATPDQRSKTKKIEIEKEYHKVQILDPAAGTGTFLAEIVKHIYKNFEGQEGIWSQYVENHLIPRLNGFEILMASYAMAHLKLDLLLAETGYMPKTDQRFRIYLTNSLEEHHPDTGTLFAGWLSREANEANHIKRDTPVMVVLGNPPYSGESQNKGQWIMNLMDDYKKEPGGTHKLKEKNSKWINDDYVKFIRYGQHFIEQNGEGILAFINPHGFLDNPTFRGMRWNLLKTYDKIYTIDLHGNSNKKEVCPDGSPDVNVFDIQQGVSINIFVKTGNKKTNQLGTVYHYDHYGLRESKYNFLRKNNIQTINYKKLPNKAPMYFMVQKDFEKQKVYEEGFPLVELFIVNSAGIVTARDNLTIQTTKEKVDEVVRDFVGLEIEEARTKYSLGKDVLDWKVHLAQEDLRLSNLSKDNICKITYRPFEVRWTYYTGQSKGFHCRPRSEIMSHFHKKENLGLIVPKQFSEKELPGAFITKNIAGHKTCSAYNINNIFPLYIYSDAESKEVFVQENRTPNLNIKIVNALARNLRLTFTREKEEKEGTFAPIDIFDYIYAILHSTIYREKYKEFLKIDFPRVPYPKDLKTFRRLVNLGGELRQNHLLESSKVEQFITTYPEDGKNEVKNILYKDYKVWINNWQYFDKVPQIAWEFYIGGYQPAQKWLKDRKGRQLSYDDIMHYQKIIVALTETDRIMKEIDKTDFMNF